MRLLELLPLWFCCTTLFAVFIGIMGETWGGFYHPLAQPRNCMKISMIVCTIVFIIIYAKMS